MWRHKSNLEYKISNLPDQPGVYLMKDRHGDIIYIGKASSLKKRVQSYFQKSESDIKTGMLKKNISDLEYIVTDSEIEALILESTLIKENKPKFNVRLKDDKRYPYIAVTLDDDFPRVIFTRKLSNIDYRYFGPYTDAGAARNIIQSINRIFKLKTCKNKIPLKKKDLSAGIHESSSDRPCINFQMKRCQGICKGTITREEYRSIIEHVMEFLAGNVEPVEGKLRTLMEEYSKNLEFEKAASIRDIINDINRFSQSQNVYTHIGRDQDYIAMSMDRSEALLIMFEFRSGALIGKKISVFDNIAYAGHGEITKSFILDFYKRSYIPSRIITQHKIDDKQIIEKYLTGLASRKTRISRAKIPADRGIINMILKNIDILKSERESYKTHRDKESGLRELMEILKIKTFPEIIECFDISNIQGKHAVASMVQFRNGSPEKSSYRRYRIRGYDSPNDPGMIHEAVGRRIQYLVNEGVKFPDLIVIDGGKPQLSRASEIIRAYRLDIQVISLAKKFEEIYSNISTKPIRLTETSKALAILKNLRDEAHRFAIKYHKNLRERELKKSELDNIPDIGEKRKKTILNHMKSIDNIKKATVENLSGLPGIGRETAKKIYNFFH